MPRNKTVPVNEIALNLIPLIYDAAENAALWPEVLNQIGRGVEAVGKVFTIDDLQQGKSNMTAALDIDPAYHRLYNERYEALNLHLQRARPLLKPGRVMASHQLCSDQEILATEYYQEFLRPQDGWFHVMGGCVAKDRSLLSVLSFMRGRRSGQFSKREITFLENLMPHLQRAARLHRVFARHHEVTECLEALPVATLLVTEHGHVEFANRAALGILKTNDGVGLDRQGCLTSTNRKLREIIAAACLTANGCGLASGGSLLIGRNSAKRPYTASVSPIRQAHLFSTVQYHGAVVFLSDPETKQEPIMQVLGNLYHLTPTEARLATLLVEGKDLKEASTQLGIRQTTARTHLRRLSDKLGARRQAEVVSIILRTVGVLACRPNNL